MAARLRHTSPGVSPITLATVAICSLVSIRSPLNKGYQLPVEVRLHASSTFLAGCSLGRGSRNDPEQRVSNSVGLVPDEKLDPTLDVSVFR
jgi:hypothetical protein